MARAARDEQGNPQSRFEVGDRAFSHYQMAWGTVEKVVKTEEVFMAGDPTGEFDTWYEWRQDDGTTFQMNDGGTMGWDMCRIMPAEIQRRWWPKHPDPQAETWSAGHCGFEG